jgi:pilus assembly protein CpaB
MAIALILGVAAATVGYYALTAVSARASAGVNSQYQEVVTTAADVTFGVKLEKTMLRMARYPKDAVPEGAYASLDSVVGQTTKVFLGAREPITHNKLSSRGGGLSMLVRPTMRAVSIEVNQVSGVSGFVIPGDRVDVLSTSNASGRATAVTRTVLQNVEVLAAGQKTDPKEKKPNSVQAVTLLVEPAGAEIVAHALHEGEIHLVLRNPEDQEQVQLAHSEQIVKNNPGVRTTRSGPARVGTQTSSDPGKVRIIRSAQVTEQPAVQDSTR